jgi:hypothetical protein
MDNHLQEICVGDWIQFHESLERTGYNRDGNPILLNRNQGQVVRGQVVGKTRTGKLKLQPCYTYKKEWSKQEKTTRKPDKLFQSYACLELRNKRAERGELLVCSRKSTHPDAQKHIDIGAAIRRHGEAQYRKFSIYRDDLARTIHDDTCREIRREKREAV